jgi:hypothetical protein
MKVLCVFIGLLWNKSVNSPKKSYAQISIEAYFTNYIEYDRMVIMNENVYKRIKGSIRKDHYESGGTPAMWRGASNKHTDKKKQNNKYKCRETREEE